MLPLSTYKDLDPKIKRIFDEISYRAVNGRMQPLLVDEAHRKIGINTDNPTKELDVNGDIKAKGGYYDYIALLGCLSAAGIDVKSLLTTARLGVTDSAFINNATLFGTTNASNLNALTTTLKDTTITGDLTVTKEIEGKKILADEGNIGNLKAASLGVAQHLIAGTGSIGCLITNRIEGLNWSTYLPSWTGLTVGNGTLSFARYSVIGKTVTVFIKLIWGSTTSISGDVSVSLPVPAFYGYTSETRPTGGAEFFDSGTARYWGFLRFDSTTTVRLTAGLASGTYLGSAEISSTVPFTWTTNDQINLAFSYESI